jgi:hypothetical protein
MLQICDDVDKVGTHLRERCYELVNTSIIEDVLLCGGVKFDVNTKTIMYLLRCVLGLFSSLQHMLHTDTILTNVMNEDVSGEGDETHLEIIWEGWDEFKEGLLKILKFILRDTQINHEIDGR